MATGDHRPAISTRSGPDHKSLPTRRRLARAAAEVVHASGLHAVTVAAVAKAAGTTPQVFEETFGDLDACLRFGVSDTFERLTAPLRGLPGGGWRERLEAGVGAYYAAIAAEPLLAELYLLHSYGIGLRPGDPGLHESVLAFVPLLEAARSESGQETLPARVEEFLGWAIVAAATRSVRRGRSAELPGQTAEVAAFVAIFFTPDRRVPQPPEAVPSPK
jgi:AcrR family transcriptional regulator